jgi:NAD(P)-dependent dehydrogenase (short-subunit alcohol dehydrogenase family)
VTGANRGLGKRLTAELVKRGARVYAGARNPGAIEAPGVTPVRLDITDHASIMAALAVAGDTTLLINNAGVMTRSSLLEGDLQQIRFEMDTHYFGTLAMIRAFAPIIAANGGGAVLNVLSVLAWVSIPSNGAYCAAKSAEWSLTNALRLELAPLRIRVSALYVGWMDTDMARDVTAPKSDLDTVAALALNGVAAGDYEILADDVSRQVQASLARGVARLYPDLP